MMKNNGVRFSKEVEDELSARKFRNDRILKDRIDGLKERYPKVYKLREELNGIGYDMGLKMIDSPGDAQALEGLARKLTEAKRRELSAALLEYGLPADYLERPSACPVCRDTGVVDGQMCSCIKQIVINSAFKGSGLNREQTFSNFRRDIFTDPNDRKTIDKVYSYCRRYADLFPNNELPDLLLMGVPGVGKTFLLNCIGAAVLENGYSVLKITANRLVGNVLDTIRGEETERPDYILPELLIIDDLGAEPMINNVTIESLLSIVTERQDQGRATLVATNLDPSQIQSDYGTRLLSRLISPNRVRVIELRTPSVRLMKL